MNDADKATIRARLAAATPGPWSNAGYYQDEPNGPHVVDAADADICVVAERANEGNIADLIAHAPADLAALLAALDEMKARAERAEKLALIGLGAAVEWWQEIADDDSVSAEDRAGAHRMAEEMRRLARMAPKWTPTADAINSLPAPLRQYVHDLETRCDPSGDIQQIAAQRENIDGLLARLAEVERERDELRAMLAEAEATLANERGEGQPPSEGWVWSADKAGGLGWSKGAQAFTAQARNREWAWKLIGGKEWGAAPTAREAMRAADAALGGGR